MKFEFERGDEKEGDELTVAERERDRRASLFRKGTKENERRSQE
jgi:hypothetical protein